MAYASFVKETASTGLLTFITDKKFMVLYFFSTKSLRKYLFSNIHLLKENAKWMIFSI